MPPDLNGFTFNKIALNSYIPNLIKSGKGLPESEKKRNKPYHYLV